jgi:hypothetical protein
MRTVRCARENAVEQVIQVIEERIVTPTKEVTNRIIEVRPEPTTAIPDKNANALRRR